MAYLFRHQLLRALIAALSLIAMGGIVADAGAASAAKAGHHKALHNAKKPKKKKRPRKGTRKPPARNGSVAAPRPPVIPAIPAFPAPTPATPLAPVSPPPAPAIVTPPAPVTTPPVTTPPVTTPPVTTPPPPSPPVTTVTTPPVAGIGPLDVVNPFPLGMKLFAPASFWNRELPAGEPLDSRSPQLATNLANEVRAEMPTRKGPWLNMNAWSVPVYTVGADVPKVHVTLDTGVVQLQRDFDAVPIPANVHVSAGTDKHLVVYQPSSDTFWEFYRMQKLADGWHARWGGKMTNVSTSPGYFPNSFGASATSLPLLGGLTTIAELRARRIDHALAMAIPNTDRDHVTFPAQRGDGRVSGPTAIPQGTQFRIDPSVDLSKLGLTPAGLAFARAAQRYGMVVRDSADCVTFYVEDPTGTVANPYKELLGGLYPDQALRNFPWDRLQVVAPRRP
jgi:hypothetical protein